jgi:hypothetical protein
MSAKVYDLTPKGSVWLVYHRHWKLGGCVTNWSFVFNYTQGLTAFEAWQISKLPNGPPFYEVVAVMLTEFSGVSAGTKAEMLTSRAQEAFNKLRQRVTDNDNIVESGTRVLGTEEG